MYKSGEMYEKIIYYGNTIFDNIFSAIVNW